MNWLSPLFFMEEKIWGKNGNNLLTSMEIKFFRRTARFFDYKKNKQILEELKAEPAGDKPRRYKSNWLQHVTRMSNNRMPKIMLNCRTNGRRRLGRPLKKLSDETVTGLSGPNA